MKKILSGAVVSVTLALVFGGIAWAGDPGAAIKYRKATMRALGGHMAAMGDLVRGGVDNPGHLAVQAKALDATATLVPDLFPKGSDFGRTQAKPEIWTQWDKFKGVAADLHKATAKLVKAADSKNQKATMTAFVEVGKACKACHKHYRKEEKR